VSEPVTRHRRPLRWFLFFLVALALAVALAPTILSWGFLRGIVRDRVAALVIAPVEVGSVSAGWFSGIAVRGLEIGGPDAADRLSADVRIRNGLLGLLLSAGGRIAIDLEADARVRTTLGPDGTIGLVQLFRPTADATAPPQAPPPSGEGAARGLPPGIALDAKGRIDLELVRTTTEGGSETYAVRDAVYGLKADGDAGTLELSLAARTETLGSQGSVDLAAKLAGWKEGVTGLGGVSGSLAFQSVGLRVPAGDATAEFGQLDLKVSSPALGRTITLGAHGRGTLRGGDADGETLESTLSATLQLDRPLGDDGNFDFHLGNLSGAAEANRLPTGILQPALAGTGIVLAEDVGPTVDFRLSAPGSDDAPFTASLVSRAIRLEVTAALDPETVHARNATVSGTVLANPGTVRRLAGQEVTAPVRLGLAATGLNWTPQPDRPASEAIRTLTGSASVRPLSSFAWLAPGGDAIVAVAGRGEIAVSLPTAGGDAEVTARLAIAAGAPEETPEPPSQPNLRLAATLPLSFEAIRGLALDLETELSPALAARLADRTLGEPLPLRLAVRDLVAPLRPGANPFAGVAGSLALSVPATVPVEAPGLDRPVRVGPIEATLATADLASLATVRVTAGAEAAELSLEQEIRGLSTAALGDPLRLDTRGTLAARGLDGATLAALVASQADLILAAGPRDMTLDLANEPVAGGQRVRVTLGGAPVAGTAAATLRPDAVTLESLDLEGSVTPALLAKLQGDRPEPVRLARDLPFRIATLAPAALTGPAAADAPIAVSLSVPSASLAAVPGVAEPFLVEGLAVEARTDRSFAAVDTTGSFSLADAAGTGERIRDLSFRLAYRAPIEGAAPTLLRGVAGEMRVGMLPIPLVERLLGLEPKSVATWTGESGAISLAMRSKDGADEVRIEPSFPRFVGRIDVAGKGSEVRADLDGVRLELTAAALQDRISPGDAADRAGRRTSVQSGLTVSVPRGTVRLPQALAADGWSWRGAAGELAIETSPVTVRTAGGDGAASTQELPALTLAARSDGLERGATLRIGERVAAGGTSRIEANVRLSNLLATDGALAAAAARADGEVSLRALPTILLDLVSGRGDTLVRTLGDRLDATVSMRELSRDAGELSAELKAPFADLAAPSVRIADGLVLVAEAKPLVASFALSPGIRDDLLHVINPVFRDLKLRGERARLSVPRLALPLDLAKDAVRFDGLARLDVGAVDLDASQGLGTILALLKDRPAPGVEGLVLPLELRIERGILSYEDFGLRLGKSSTGWRTAMDFRGRIDLTKSPYFADEITTTLPISQVAAASADVRRFLDRVGGPDSEIARTLGVGVTMSGPLYTPDGKPAELAMRLALPTLDSLGEQIRKDPTKAIDQGLKIFDAIRGKDRPKP